MNRASLVGVLVSLIYRELCVSCLGKQLDLLRGLYAVGVILEHFQELYDLEYPDALLWIARGLKSQLVREYIGKLAERNEHLRREGHFLFVLFILVSELLHDLFQGDPLTLHSLVKPESPVVPRWQLRTVNLEVIQPHAVRHVLGPLDVYIREWTG